MKLIMENWNKFVAESDRLTRAIDDSEARDAANQDFQDKFEREKPAHDAYAMLSDFLEEEYLDWMLEGEADEEVEQLALSDPQKAVVNLAKWVSNNPMNDTGLGERFIEYVKNR